MSRDTRFHSQVRRLLKAVSHGPVTSSVAFQLSRSGLLPSAVWRRLPVRGEFDVRLDGGHSFRYSSDDGLGRALFWKGMSAWCEATELRDFCRLAAHARRFVDVGANTGVYSLLACAVNSECRVMAFEPVPRLHEHLTANLQLNGWTDRCAIHREAVSDFVGTAKFHVPLTAMPTSASLNESGFRDYAGECIEVPVTTLDVVCGDTPIDLMKIDVEGFEDKVLRGMPTVLERDHPDLIIECLPDGPYRDVQAILQAAGYRFLHMGPNGPVAKARIEPDPTERYRDYLCTTNSSIEKLFQ